MNNNSAERIILALDFKNKEEIAAMTKALKGDLKFVKVGMELYYSQGPDIVKFLKDQDLKVFLDLKLHDIPNTVYNATQSLAQLGVDIINVHAGGGIQMMKAAKGALLEELGDYDLTTTDRPSSKKPFLIGVTQLTSTDQNVMNNELNISGTVEDAVLNMAKNVKTAGLDGIVASAHEVKRIKEELGKGFVTVTPGIRPNSGSTHNKSDDQKRVMTPAEAVRIGTDYMVIGRAITKADDPKAAFNSILEEIAAVAA